MGKIRGKNLREDSKNRTSVQSAPKPTVERDNFFMKPKIIKENKTFERRQVSKNLEASSSGAHTKELKEEKTKKPFDKKQWRIKKYSNKYKVDKWQEMRKKDIIKQYHKFTLKGENKGLDVMKIYEEYDEKNSESDENVDDHKERVANETKSPMKHGPRSKHDKMLEMKEEKTRRREEILKKKAEKEEALKLSRKKKAERYKRLNKKTKKGQPIMKDRLEMLYEQVQKICQE